MKKILLFQAFILLTGFNLLFGQPFLTQASIQRTSGLVITVYAKPIATVNIGTNVLFNFSLSLPGNTGPFAGSLGKVSLIGGGISVDSAENIGGRKNYPFVVEASSTVALTANVSTPVASITFPSSEIGDLVQMNDWSGTGSNSCFFYVSYFGTNNTNVNAMFYGTNAVNIPGGDSHVDANLALPVTLVAFEAEKFQEVNTRLSWSTASETNSSHFLIQRSDDQKSWTNVGKVNAAGESQIIQNYEFVDVNVYNKRDAYLSVYYRLQMVDFDGQAKNSPIDNVVFGNVSNNAQREFAVYPNPSTDGLNVEWDANRVDQPTALEFFDIEGKLVYSQKVSENTNQSYVDFGRTTIQPGLYLLRILNGIEPLEYKQIVVGNR